MPYNAIEILLHRHTVDHMQLIHYGVLIHSVSIFIEEYVPQVFTGAVFAVFQRNGIGGRGIVGRHKGTLGANARRYPVLFQLHRRSAQLHCILPTAHRIIRLFFDGIRSIDCNSDWIRIMRRRQQHTDKRIIRRSHRRPGRHKGSQKQGRQHAYAHQRRFQSFHRLFYPFCPWQGLSS